MSDRRIRQSQTFIDAEKLRFDAQTGVTEGIKEIYLALKSGKVDVGPKTVTVQWYRNILEAKRLVDAVLLDGRII